MTDKILRLGFLALLLGSLAHAGTGGRSFPDSLAPMGTAGETMVRTTLTPSELAAPMDFTIALRMREADRLQDRLKTGHLVPAEEMEAKYLPLLSDYNRIAQWLTAQGFILILPDSNHTNIFARGTVSQVAQAFDVRFVRVSNADGEFTSAITAPTLPAELAGPVLAIDGLQPHIRSHPPRHRGKTRADVVTSGPGGLFTPADINAAYNVPSSLTGSGQTIAIVMDASVKGSDLTTFWTTSGLAQTAGNVTVITVPANSTPGTTDADESSLDVEWAGGMAPAAKIRLYAIPSLTSTNIVAAFTQILNDAAANHITVVSMSFSGTESGLSLFQQSFAAMVAAGITPCASSGDGGSRPNSATGAYSLSSSLSAAYPASDQNVIGVGGTTIAFNINAGYTDTGETVWFQPTPLPAGGSGGGLSGLVAKPSWQVGTGVPAVGVRCVPDVSAVSVGSTNGTIFGAFTEVNGSVIGGGGTSLSVQTFAGIVALINQARATAGLGSLGPMGPSLYPLNPANGSGAFTDITSGTNGTDGNYNAGTGYDLCTGLGSPNVGNLVLALGGVLPPAVTTQPISIAVTAGNPFSFTITATGGGTLTYQWSLNGAAISGAISPTFSKGSASASDAGSYTVVVTNAAGSTTSATATLTVSAAPSAAPASSGGGGGGGAPSLWFYGALALLGGLRLLTRRAVRGGAH